MAILIMVHSQHNDNQHLLNPVLHDFLGMKPAADTSADVRLPEPSASASSAGARGPFSSTSDTASGECYLPPSSFAPIYLFSKLEN